MSVVKYLDDLVEAVTGGSSVDDAVRAVAMRMRGEDPSDWRMRHRPPSDLESGAPLSDLSGIFPEDVYTNPRIYAYSPEEEAIGIMARRLRGRPDEMVDMYRAVPRWVSGIETGDWVTPSYRYAMRHADIMRRSDFPTAILRGKARAGDLLTEGNSLAEYGYTGASIVPAMRMNAPRVSKALVSRAQSGDVEAIQQLARLYGLESIARGFA